MMKALSPRPWWWMCILLAGIGFAISADLTGRSLDLLASRTPGAPDLCAWLGASCDATLSDPGAWFMRIPLAGWGVAYFTALSCLLLLARFTKGAFEAEALLAAWLIAALGLATGIGLTVWQIARHEPLCPPCLAVHTISLLLLPALRAAGPRPLSEQLHALRDAARWLVRSETESSERARWNVVGFACVALAAAFAWQWVYVESALRRPSEPSAPDRAEVIADFQRAPAITLPVSEGDPRLGSSAAPVWIVVFESFRCPACRRLSGTLSRLHHEFGDRLAIVFKHYPLSTECNGRLTQDLQPGACEIARAAEAANLQQRFWAFHDVIFAALGGDPAETIADAAR